MDFDLTERQAFFRNRVRRFIDQHIRPRVADYKKEIDSGDRWQPLQLIEQLKEFQMITSVLVETPTRSDYRLHHPDAEVRVDGELRDAVDRR